MILIKVAWKRNEKLISIRISVLYYILMFIDEITRCG